MIGVEIEKWNYNKGPTLTLFKSDKNNIFGGYSSKSWTSRDG